MTKNMIDALRLQEDTRHHKVSEITEPITSTIGATGTVLRGISGFSKAPIIKKQVNKFKGGGNYRL